MESIQRFINLTFGIENETSSPIIITIIVFISGFTINWLKSLISNYLKRKHFRLLFISTVQSIAEKTLKQSENYEQLVNQLNINHNDDFRVKTTVITHLDNVNRLDYQRIYDSFFSGFENFFSTKLKIDTFNEIFSQISLIQELENNFRQGFIEFNLKFNSLLDKRNDTMEDFRKYSDNLIQSTTGTQIPANLGTYLTNYDRILLNWQRIEDRLTLNNTHLHLITPLLQLNREFQDLRATLFLNNYLLSLDFNYSQINKLLDIERDNVAGNYSENYRLASEKLLKAVSELR